MNRSDLLIDCWYLTLEAVILNKARIRSVLDTVVRQVRKLVHQDYRLRRMSEEDIEREIEALKDDYRRNLASFDALKMRKKKTEWEDEAVTVTYRLLIPAYRKMSLVGPKRKVRKEIKSSKRW